jgi:diguanylate cyclase (GGDEF)-like protein
MLWGFFTVLMLGNVSLMAIAVGRLLIGVRRLSERDALTGLWNRRAMEERIRKERSRLHRGGRCYSMAIVDLDHFKRLNDTMGHAAGDAALCHVARVLDEQMRSLDVLSRFGGEEFLILMPLTDRLGALEAARRLQAALAANPLLWKGIEHVLSASIGVAESLPEGDDATFRAADDALYRAKRNGRNCVECALPVARHA